MRPLHGLVLILWALAGIGCSSGVPPAIRGDVPGQPLNPVSVAQVQRGADAYSGQRVRWGGSILAVRNLPNSTEIEVLSRTLASDGEPRADADGEGRFIARVPEFIDPAEYAKDRLLTVVGRIDGVETRDVGEYPYRYPVVAVSSRYLWPAAESYGYPPGYGFPYGYPWYSGYYGYGGWYGPGYGSWFGPGFGPGYGPGYGRWYGPW
jgi:outer membrane lipoprotein